MQGQRSQWGIGDHDLSSHFSLDCYCIVTHRSPWPLVTFFISPPPDPSIDPNSTLRRRASHFEIAPLNHHHVSSWLPSWWWWWWMSTVGGHCWSVERRGKPFVEPDLIRVSTESTISEPTTWPPRKLRCWFYRLRGYKACPRLAPICFRGKQYIMWRCRGSTVFMLFP